MFKHKNKKFENGHLLVQLNYTNGKYFIENTIPVSISQDNILCGYRIIRLISLNSGNLHSFRVCNKHKYKSLNNSLGLTGIILSK